MNPNKRPQQQHSSPTFDLIKRHKSELQSLLLQNINQQQAKDSEELQQEIVLSQFAPAKTTIQDPIKEFIETSSTLSSTNPVLKPLIIQRALSELLARHNASGYMQVRSYLLDRRIVPKTHIRQVIGTAYSRNDTQTFSEIIKACST